MVENVRFNRLFGRVHPMLGDSKELVETKLQGVADRVLMPLPEKALEYLPAALSALRVAGYTITTSNTPHPKKTPSSKQRKLWLENSTA